MRKLTEIIIHCSATEAGNNIKAADIKKWHTDPKSKGGNGWKDIGYHYVVDLDGTIEQGRPLDVVGAHVKNHNANTIGICYVGGLRNGVAADTRTMAQREALKHLIKSLLVVFPTVKKVTGHRDYAAKACPCFDAANEYRLLIR